MLMSKRQLAAADDLARSLLASLPVELLYYPLVNP